MSSKFNLNLYLTMEIANGKKAQLIVVSKQISRKQSNLTSNWQ